MESFDKSLLLAHDPAMLLCVCHLKLNAFDEEHIDRSEAFEDLGGQENRVNSPVFNITRSWSSKASKRIRALVSSTSPPHC